MTQFNCVFSAKYVDDDDDYEKLQYTLHSQSNSYIGLDRNNTAGYLGEEEYEEYEDECSIFDVWNGSAQSSRRKSSRT